MKIWTTSVSRPRSRSPKSELRTGGPGLALRSSGRSASQEQFYDGLAIESDQLFEAGQRGKEVLRRVPQSAVDTQQLTRQFCVMFRSLTNRLRVLKARPREAGKHWHRERVCKANLGKLLPLHLLNAGDCLGAKAGVVERVNEGCQSRACLAAVFAQIERCGTVMVFLTWPGATMAAPSIVDAPSVTS